MQRLMKATRLAMYEVFNQLSVEFVVVFVEIPFQFPRLFGSGCFLSCSLLLSSQEGFELGSLLIASPEQADIRRGINELNGTVSGSR